MGDDDILSGRRITKAIIVIVRGHKFCIGPIQNKHDGVGNPCDESRQLISVNAGSRRVVGIRNDNHPGAFRHCAQDAINIDKIRLLRSQNDIGSLCFDIDRAHDKVIMCQDHLIATVEKLPRTQTD